MLTGWPLERLLLILGQLLNALIALTIYAAVWLLIRSRRAGYLAALLVALPFFFPAYYTTWGRLTQLTAVLVLPLMIAFIWQIVRGDEAWIDRWWLAGILAAGMFLIHFRVFVYFLPFPLLTLLVSRFRRVRWLGAAALLTFILALPRIFTLLKRTPTPCSGWGGTIPDYNKFPVNYLNTGWERLFLIAAAVALIVVLIAVLRRQTWTVLPLVLVAWVASLFVLLSLDQLGIPMPSLVNLNSMYITLFIPLAIFSGRGFLNRSGGGWKVRGGRSELPAMHWPVSYWPRCSFFGVRRQVTILNQQTLLAQFEDMAALSWLEDNLPDDARVAANSWRWLGQTWAVSDGGGWILPLTKRSVTTPPIDYVYNRDLFTQVQAFNETASAVTDWSDPAQAAWLRGQGVSHIFVGKRGGFFDPAKLARNPRMDKLFDQNGVFIFSVKE